MKYYLLSLNNNICSFENDRPWRYNHDESYFNHQPSRDFKIPIVVEMEYERILFFKPKTKISNSYKNINVFIVGIEKDGKIFDVVTKKEIAFANEQEAHGPDSTFHDYLTYSSKRELTEDEVANCLEPFIENEENYLIYVACMKKVEDYNHSCYLQTKKAKDETLARTRNILNEFQNRYGNK